MVYFLSPLSAFTACIASEGKNEKADKIKNKKSCLLHLSFYPCVRIMPQLLIHWENGKLDFVQDTTISSCKINGDFVPASIGRKCRLIRSIAAEFLVDFYICVDLPDKGTCSHVTYRSTHDSQSSTEHSHVAKIEWRLK